MLREPHTFHLQEALEGILDANLTEHVDWSEKIFYSHIDFCLGTLVVFGCKCALAILNLNGSVEDIYSWHYLNTSNEEKTPIFHIRKVSCTYWEISSNDGNSKFLHSGFSSFYLSHYLVVWKRKRFPGTNSNPKLWLINYKKTMTFKSTAYWRPSFRPAH